MTTRTWPGLLSRFRLFGLRASRPATQHNPQRDRARARAALRGQLSDHLLRDIGLGEG